MDNQENIEMMMKGIEENDGKVLFLPEVHKSSCEPLNLPTPDFFSIIKFLFKKD